MYAISREQVYTTRFHLDALRAKLRKLSANELPELTKMLANYEATGDHKHGGRSLKPGEPCPGGDCYAAKARDLIKALTELL
jgi:hypothetical protein